MFGLLEGVFGNMRVSVLMLMIFFIVGFFLLLKTYTIEKRQGLSV